MFKERLETLLRQSGEINSVSASILTGNVLVIFDPECNARLIFSMLEKTAIDHMRSQGIETEDVGQTKEVQLSRATVTRARTRKRGPGQLPATIIPAVGQRTDPWHLMETRLANASFNSYA